jgi:hypothetical protein
MAYDAATRTVVLFGGFGTTVPTGCLSPGSGEYFQQTWTWG